MDSEGKKESVAEKIIKINPFPLHKTHTKKLNYIKTFKTQSRTY